MHYERCLHMLAKFKTTRGVVTVLGVGVVMIFYMSTIIHPPAIKSTPVTQLDFLGHNLSFSQYSQYQIFKSRQQHLLEQCRLEGIEQPANLVDSKITSRFIYETKHDIVYCPIEKVASTFWKKTLTAIKSDGKYESPFSVKLSPRYKILSFKNLIRDNSTYSHTSILKDSVSLLVVRDPYTKLFSGYVDKLYHPNSFFWKNTGVYVKLASIRNGGQRNKSKQYICGNDVTFAEFIKYIIYTHKHDLDINQHFTTITKHCTPCNVHYDYINKLETFKEDVLFILDDWNKKFNTNIHFDDFYKETAQDAAKTHIRLSLNARRVDSRRCQIKPYNFLLRTWRFLQITGLIPKSAKLPYLDTPGVVHVSAEHMSEAVHNVLAERIDWTEVKKQRHEALVQAYHTVPLRDMNELRKIVKSDCEYFDYDDRPTALFERNNTESDNYTDFNYFDGLDN